MSLSSRDWRALLTLNGELAEITPHDPAAAVRHALDSLYPLIGAEEGFIVFSVLTDLAGNRTDPLNGWRPVRALYNGRQWERMRRIEEWYSDSSRVFEDPLSQGLAQRSGVPRAYLRRDLVSDRVWGRLPAVAELLSPLGVRDRLISGIPIAPKVEAFLGADRLSGDFTPRERDVLRIAAHHLGWFARRLAEAQGLIGEALPHLSRRERETLRLLLTSRTEKAIAAQMGLSLHTTRQHVRSVHRKFGTGNRHELMARFLGRMPLLAPSTGGSVYDSPRDLALRLSVMDD